MTFMGYMKVYITTKTVHFNLNGNRFIILSIYALILVSFCKLVKNRFYLTKLLRMFIYLFIYQFITDRLITVF